MEAPFPPQHLAAVGGFVLYGSLLLPHGVPLDAKWKRGGVHQVQSGRKPFAVGQPPRYFPDQALSVLDGS